MQKHGKKRSHFSGHEGVDLGQELAVYFSAGGNPLVMLSLLMFARLEKILGWVIVVAYEFRGDVTGRQENSQFSSIAKNCRKEH